MSLILWWDRLMCLPATGQWRVCAVGLSGAGCPRFCLLLSWSLISLLWVMIKASLHFWAQTIWDSCILCCKSFMRISDCRFLRAREFDIEKSKELYCKYIEKVSLSPLHRDRSWSAFRLMSLWLLVEIPVSRKRWCNPADCWPYNTLMFFKDVTAETHQMCTSKQMCA